MPLPLSKPDNTAKPPKKRLNGFSVADIFSSKDKDDQQQVQLPPPKPVSKAPPAAQPSKPQPNPPKPAQRPPQKRKDLVQTKIGQAVGSSSDEEEEQQVLPPPKKAQTVTKPKDVGLQSSSHQQSPPNAPEIAKKKAKQAPSKPATTKSTAGDDFKLDDLFGTVKQTQKENLKAEKTQKYLQQQENAKKNREAAKAGKSFDASHGNPMDLNDDMGFSGQGGGSRKRTDEGFLIYTYDELKFEEGGDTELCPFDCDCCYA